MSPNGTMSSGEAIAVEIFKGRYTSGEYADYLKSMTLKKGYKRSDGVLTEKAFDNIQNMFPNVVSQSTYERESATIGRVDFMYRIKMKDGTSTDIIVTYSELLRHPLSDAVLATKAIIRSKLKEFFGMPVKRKKPTLSKKQRELKKSWLLK